MTNGFLDPVDSMINLIMIAVRSRHEKAVKVKAQTPIWQQPADHYFIQLCCSFISHNNRKTGQLVG